MDHPHHQQPTKILALSATLHCLTGCAIGEILGLVIGTALGLANGSTIALSVALAFLFGYLLSTLPVLKAGLAVGAALSVVLAADTLSISIGVAERAGNRYWNWARDLVAAGKNVELYACEGPSRDLDPYVYYRLASWRAVSIYAEWTT